MIVTVGLSLALTLLTVLISVAGLLLFRMLKSHDDDLKTQHEVADPYSQFVGMLFAVLLGFMVADAMQRFELARQTVEQEASSLANVYRMADGLPEANRIRVQNLCLAYSDEVIKAWPLLAKKQTSPTTWDTYRRLWKELTLYEPVTPRQCNVQQSILPCMASLGDCRRLRVDALHNGMPAVLWCILSVGGVATIIFTYFFSSSNLNVQMVMVAIVSLVICLNIFLLACYDDPFSGDVMIEPTAFETQSRLFREEMKLPAAAPQ